MYIDILVVVCAFGEIPFFLFSLSCLWIAPGLCHSVHFVFLHQFTNACETIGQQISFVFLSVLNDSWIFDRDNNLSWKITERKTNNLRLWVTTRGFRLEIQFFSPLILPDENLKRGDGASEKFLENSECLKISFSDLSLISNFVSSIWRASYFILRKWVVVRDVALWYFWWILRK